jgi:hypothetical protein
VIVGGHILSFLDDAIERIEAQLPTFSARGAASAKKGQQKNE